MSTASRVFFVVALALLTPWHARATTISVDNTAASLEVVGSNIVDVSDFTVGNDPTNPFRYLFVVYAGEQSAQPTNVTYGGISLTPLVSTATSVSHASIFGLANPTPGTADISVTGSGTNGAFYGVLSVKSDGALSIHDTQSTTAASGVPSDLVYAPLLSNGFFIEAVERNNITDGLSLPDLTGTALFGPSNGEGGFGAVGVYDPVASGPLSHSYVFSDRHAIAGVALVTVPEPSTLALLLGLGSIGLLGYFWRRRRS